MTRIRMKLHYTDLHNCLIRIRDMGFGEFAAASESGASAGRVWESILTI